MKKALDGAGKPRIKMTAEDHERLSGLATAAMDRMPDVAAALADELDRAQIIRDRRYSGGFVRMGCGVEFRDETTGRSQTVTLVYPREADIEQGKVSVMTPVGAALIGLSPGQAIDWETRSGVIKRLSVLDVKEPAVV
ncbi:nucleoside diphosphate kinase regulator [Methylobacterium oxalidis]|uniref:Nucleoside diphosphate kinase regulator n=1 Tax=Methylobacterium oxalidis TaxID=944322 RepID=A0A512JBR8_9HYPH|nr:nucleoside diphosphate kinase regulator [Methylobacterium oxalidis]GEP07335.1 nucleoside diphosphate kinase regulator [Methylobacterium oxalidis]GJE35561.1 Regulator of nucleoside diphosphate kinase [Methylobacterium oxalidis]GLS64475.1 nucleoside diphosphate kinase regulator [Methylobacterium oxalidis]